VPTETNYYCTLEWHLKRYMGGRITLAALVYPFALGISKQSGRFRCSGIELADYFNCSKGAVYEALQLLEDLGFLVLELEASGKPSVYRVLTHKEWAKTHPGKCSVKTDRDAYGSSMAQAFVPQTVTG
jgi:hypothetical protein